MKNKSEGMNKTTVFDRLKLILNLLSDEMIIDCEVFMNNRFKDSDRYGFIFKEPTGIEDWDIHLTIDNTKAKKESKNARK